LIIWYFCKWIGILRTPIKTEIIGYDFEEFAEGFEHFFEGKKLERKKKK